MPSVKKIKGFADLLPDESRAYTRMETTARRVFAAYGYGELRLPVLEQTELFSRGIGEETDVVAKEMYTFPDRRGRSLTLRPEATAGVMRAYIEAQLHTRAKVSKLFSFGPMFRYERPQKGRMRQFHQINAECVGPSEPHADAEAILMLMRFLEALSIPKLVLELNSLGCRTCRPAYNQALQAFLKDLDSAALCEDCARRLETNPLRVLDCKQPGCQPLIENAPRMADQCCQACADHHATVLGVLDAAKVPYTRNWKLVRGLDYYTRTTFEVVSGDIGSQSSVAGGGRYDGLVKALGGPDVPGVGFACGMERLAMLLPDHAPPRPDFHIAVLENRAMDAALALATRLRDAGLRGECAFCASSMKSQMRQADKSGAAYCLILGGDELDRGVVVMKDMENGEQSEASQEELVSLLVDELRV